jgi:glucose/arabinose dehydrogenase
MADKRDQVRLRTAGLLGALCLGLSACGSSASPAGFSPAPVSSTTASQPAITGPSGSPTSRPRPTLPGDVALKTIVTGLVAPDGLVAAPDNSGRLFVLDQTGKVLVVQGGQVLPEPFLDVSSKLVPLDADYDERGLLGLAFDPDFAHTGRVFVYYTARLRAGAARGQDHTDTISSFTVSPANPDQVVPGSEEVILQFEQPQANHNGGGLGFGPDGDLYIGVGDGGNEGDVGPGHSPGGNAQDPTRLNGKILRINVSGAAPYTIPPDNPYARGGGRPEIYALGLRNPWRFSWEPNGAHRLLIDDVGWGRYEEVDVGVNGGNYGWPVREGDHCVDVKAPLSDLAACATADQHGQAFIDPVFEYSHQDVGIAIVGGLVYHGSAIPSLEGKYVFADLSADWKTTTPVGRGSILAAQPAGSGTWPWNPLSVQGDPRLGFVDGIGQDAAGELYLLTRDQLGPTGQTGELLEIMPPG